MKLIKDLGMLYPEGKTLQRYRYGLYECPRCGVHFSAQTRNVKNKSSTKCKKCSAKTHGLKKHKLYTTWINEHQRCSNKNNPNYKDYGARGIFVSEEFSDFKCWLDYVLSLDNCMKSGYSVDRIDNDGGYVRGNLKWSTHTQQVRNTRKISSRNKSGYRGVFFSSSKNKWISTISVNNKKVYIGSFNNALDGAKAYDKYVIDNKLEHTLNDV